MRSVTVALDLPSQYLELCAKLEKACDELMALHRQEQDLTIRYDRAVASGRRTFLYNLRLKLTAVSGVKIYFTEYVKKLAQDVQLLEDQLGSL